MAYTIINTLLANTVKIHRVPNQNRIPLYAVSPITLLPNKVLGIMINHINHLTGTSVTLYSAVQTAMVTCYKTDCHTYYCCKVTITCSVSLFSIFYYLMFIPTPH